MCASRGPEGFEIRESSQSEVEAQLASLRPENPQTPPRDLRIREILPLERLGFEASTSVGAKAANLAELMTKADVLRIPRDVFPEMGFAVPSMSPWRR